MQRIEQYRVFAYDDARAAEVVLNLLTAEAHVRVRPDDQEEAK